MKHITRTRLTAALMATVLSIAALAQANSSAIKNAYSLGENTASRLEIRWANANNDQNPTVLAQVAAVDQSIQRHAQRLGINPQQVLIVLKGIDPGTPDGNVLSSSAEPVIEGILNTHGSSGKVVRAYSLGWKTSAYSQACTVALVAQHQHPDIAAGFMAVYPALADQLKTGASDFGVQVSSPQAGLSLTDTCKELMTTLSALNHALQVH